MIASSTVTVNEEGPAGNVPDVTVDGTTITFDVCSVSSCENDHPVVTVEIVLLDSIIGVRGSFMQVTTLISFMCPFFKTDGSNVFPPLIIMITNWGTRYPPPLELTESKVKFLFSF